jgi:hypothetical protein
MQRFQVTDDGMTFIKIGETVVISMDTKTSESTIK